MAAIISGIQQIGIGTPNVEQSWSFYRKYFGMDIKIFEEAAEAPLMTKYTGGVVQRRTATLALNMQGGGGMEIWQYTSRGTEPADFELTLGDLGLYICKIKSKDVAATYQWYKKEGLDLVGGLSKDPQGNLHFYLRDPQGNLFEVVSSTDWFSETKDLTGGPYGAVIGVSDIERSLKLYRDVLGYDVVAFDETNACIDFAALPGGGRKVRRVLLRHQEPRKGAFSKMLGASEIELVQALDYEGKKIFENRFWGDLGYIHLCFDVRNMDALKQACEAGGFPFVIDSANSFDMGQAAGRFTYIEDPDGTLIEFVETHKVPVVAKIGWYLNIENMAPEKRLPNWMLKALRFNRVKK